MMLLNWRSSNPYKSVSDHNDDCISEPEQVFEGLIVQPEIKKDILANIQRRLVPQKAKIRSGTLYSLDFGSLHTGLYIDIEVSCYGYEGIDAVKLALKVGESYGTEEIPLKVKFFIASPCLNPPSFILR